MHFWGKCHRFWNVYRPDWDKILEFFQPCLIPPYMYKPCWNVNWIGISAKLIQKPFFKHVGHFQNFILSENWLWKMLHLCYIIDLLCDDLVLQFSTTLLILFNFACILFIVHVFGYILPIWHQAIFSQYCKQFQGFACS